MAVGVLVGELLVGWGDSWCACCGCGGGEEEEVEGAGDELHFVWIAVSSFSCGWMDGLVPV